MATQANTQAAAKTASTKVKKAPVAVSQRLIDTMKRAALQGKISADELDNVANLAGALKTFIKV